MTGQNLLVGFIGSVIIAILAVGIAALVDMAGGFRRKRNVRKTVATRLSTNSDARFTQLAIHEAAKGRRSLDTIIQTIPDRLGDVGDEPVPPPDEPGQGDRDQSDR